MMQRKSVENRGRIGPVEEVSENNSAGMTEMNVVSVEVGDQTLAQDMTTAESEVSRIFGKGASGLCFEPVQSITPSRNEFKRNASVGSDGCLESDLDSSKKLRLDLSLSKGKPFTLPLEVAVQEEQGAVDDSAGIASLHIPQCDEANEVVSTVQGLGDKESRNQPEMTPKQDLVDNPTTISSNQDILVRSEEGISDQVS